MCFKKLFTFYKDDCIFNYKFVFSEKYSVFEKCPCLIFLTFKKIFIFFGKCLHFSKTVCVFSQNTLEKHILKTMVTTVAIHYSPEPVQRDPYVEWASGPVRLHLALRSCWAQRASNRNSMSHSKQDIVCAHSACRADD